MKAGFVMIRSIQRVFAFDEGRGVTKVIPSGCASESDRHMPIDNSTRTAFDIFKSTIYVSQVLFSIS